MFTQKTLSFLRSLKRNNNREWFRARKDQYETHVRAPMVALLERLARDMRTFAPELIADPKVSLFRIYRDTRFSSDKRPLKTNVAAHFPSRKFPKGEGAGMHIEVASQWVWMGGGIYMPSSGELHAIRAAIADDHRRFRRVVTAPAFRRERIRPPARSGPVRAQPLIFAWPEWVVLVPRADCAPADVGSQQRSFEHPISAAAERGRRSRRGLPRPQLHVTNIGRGVPPRLTR